TCSPSNARTPGAVPGVPPWVTAFASSWKRSGRTCATFGEISLGCAEPAGLRQRSNSEHFHAGSRTPAQRPARPHIGHMMSTPPDGRRPYLVFAVLSLAMLALTAILSVMGGELIEPFAVHVP